MAKKIFTIALFIALVSLPVLSHAELEGHWVERDYKTNKIKRLVSQLYDKEKRMEAKKDLSNYGPQVIEYVLPLLEDKNNESVRVAALYVIGQAGDISLEEVVVERLKDPSKRVRREAVNTLDLIGAKVPVLPQVEEKTWVKRDFENNKIKRLVAQLYDKGKRTEAQRYLTNYGSEVVEHVMPLLNDKNNESVRVAALYIIGQVGDSSAEDEVVKRLRDRNRRVRQEAARTLSIIGTKKSVKPLKRLLRDPDPNIKFNALRTLARIAPEDEKGLFVSVLGDYDPRVRAFAVLALGRLKAEDAVGYISQLTQDFDPGVRMAVSRTLGAIGTKECIQPLLWLISDMDINIRISAIEHIAWINNPQVEVILLDATDNPDPRIASRAFAALRRKNSSKVLEIAKDRLDDEHINVRLESIEIIGQMGNSSDKELLKPLLEAESSRVRNKVKEALASGK